MWRPRFWDLAACILLLAILLWQIQFLERTSLFFLKTPIGFIHAISTEVKNLVGYRRLARENESLRHLVGKLVAQTEGLKAASLENERLHKLLEFQIPLVHQVVPSQVIGWDASLWTKTLLLDKGKKDGIQVGMPVVSHEGLVGRVSDVTSNSSRVQLLLDPNSRVGVLLNESREQGILVGQGSDLCRVQYLSLEAKIQPQEAILTSGIGGVFPKGILVGHVVFIGKESDGLHQYVLARPSTRFQALEEVLCLR